MRGWRLSGLADALWFAAGACSLAAAGRVAVVAASAPDPAADPLADGSSGVGSARWGERSARPPPPLVSGTARGSDRPTRSRSPTIHPHLMIGDDGEVRSAVFFDNAFLGHTPYMGEVSCREGAPVLVEVVPPRGDTRRYRGECRGTLLRLEKGERGMEERR